MKRVLVMGAAGFVGGRCLPILESKGFEVHAADIVAPKESNGEVWHEVDIMDRRQISELFAAVRPTHLLHFAWCSKPGEYWTSTENLHFLEGSLYMLRTFRECGGERIVGAGTCAEYDWRYGYFSEYTTPLNPSTLYGSCKNALQQVLENFSDVTKLSSAWGRLFFLYGPHENTRRLVASIIINLLEHNRAPCSEGKQIRDFLYIEDVASAFVALLVSDVVGPVNIASGLPISIKDVALLIADRLGRRELLGLGDIPADEEPHILLADTRRLSEEVGWHPEYDIESGIKKTIEWWQKRRLT